MKKYVTNCIKCWRDIRVLLDPPVKQINCIELECCERTSKTKLTVLIVDDDVKILSMLTKMLTRLGFEVTTVCNEKDALEQINSEKIYDLVISDLFIGKDDGLRLLYKIHKQRPSVKTILMSGSTLTEEETYCISINDFLVKPFELSELKGTIQKVLEMEVTS